MERLSDRARVIVVVAALIAGSLAGLAIGAIRAGWVGAAGPSHGVMIGAGR